MRGLGLLFGLLLLGGCEAGQPGTSGSTTITAAAATVEPEESRMWMTIGERRFAITLADTVNGPYYYSTAELPELYAFSRLFLGSDRFECRVRDKSGLVVSAWVTVERF